MSGYLIDPNHPAYPPPDVIEAAEKVGRWFAKHHIVGWQLGPCADRDKVAALLSEIERLRAGWISVEDAKKPLPGRAATQHYGEFANAGANDNGKTDREQAA